MMEFDDCVKKGLIKKKQGTEERVSMSIETSQRFLKSAKRNYEIKEYEMCFLAAYNSMFHSCRSLLFNKEYIEKSHFCLIKAIRKLYKDEEVNEAMDSFDRMRTSRHEVQYRGYFCEDEEAEFAIKEAESLIKITKKILNKN